MAEKWVEGDFGEARGTAGRELRRGEQSAVTKPGAASSPDTVGTQSGGGGWGGGGEGSPGQALITESCRDSGEEWETLAKSGRITSLWMQSSFAGPR